MEPIELTVDQIREDIRLNVVDFEDFNSRVVGAYNDGSAEKGLVADDQVARSVIPGGTGALRDFSIHRRELCRLHGMRDAMPGHRHSR